MSYFSVLQGLRRLFQFAAPGNDQSGADMLTHYHSVPAGGNRYESTPLPIEDGSVVSNCAWLLTATVPVTGMVPDFGQQVALRIAKTDAAQFLRKKKHITCSEHDQA